MFDEFRVSIEAFDIATLEIAVVLFSRGFQLLQRAQVLQPFSSRAEYVRVAETPLWTITIQEKQDPKRDSLANRECINLSWRTLRLRIFPDSGGLPHSSLAVSLFMLGFWSMSLFSFCSSWALNSLARS